MGKSTINGIMNWKDPPFLMGKSTINGVIFNSYVKLPEGNDPVWIILETPLL